MTAPALTRHRTDVAALLFGLLFIFGGLLGIAFALDWVHDDQGAWLGVALAGAGILGLIVVVIDRARPEPRRFEPSSAFPAPPIDTSALDPYDLTVPMPDIAELTTEPTRVGHHQTEDES